MSEEKKLSPSARQKRVQRLKRLIVITLFTLMLVPVVCCVVLLFQVHALNRKIDGIAERVAALEWTEHFRASLPESVTGPVRLYAGVGQGSAAEAGAAQLQSSDEISKEDSLRRVYLTFDDGPSIYTDEILDILAEYNVKATFFVVGKEDERSKEAICRIVNEGHTLGMHSYSHKYSEIYASEDDFIEDFERLQDYLKDLTGQECRFYRFPGGSSNTVSKVDMQILIDYLSSRDVVYYDWNVASGDGGKPRLSVDTLVRNSTEDVERWDNAVILLHDSGDKRTTVDALPQIIEKLQAMEDTVLLPITEDSEPVQHLH